MAKTFVLSLAIFAGLFGLACFGFLPIAAFAATNDGTVSGYAWSPQIGWVNFGTTNGSIRITDLVVTGYAWNENKGRVNLSPTNGGVANNAEGALSGYAWCEGTGWLNFTGVTVNSSGVFSGSTTAMANGNNITINFSCAKCNVSTDWRPVSARGGGSSSGGGGGGLPPASEQKPLPPFSILINNGSNYARDKNVTLSLQAGTNVAKMAISNSPDFEVAEREDYKMSRDWTLSDGDGQKTVYVKFYTQYGQASDAYSDSIILDSVGPEIKITNIKEKYNPDEEVVVGGTTEPKAHITLFINDNFSMFDADEGGNWLITLGKMAQGKHHLEISAKDLAQNTGKTETADFSVEQGVVSTPFPLKQVSVLPPLLQKIREQLNPLFPSVKKPEEIQPAKVVVLAKTPPVALSKRWNQLPISEIRNFALAPLPQDIQLIAQQLPEVKKTFAQVGISKITDVSKLKSANLKLPTLSEEIGLSSAEVQPGKFTVPKGIPIAQLTSTAKVKIPAGMVFAKGSGGLVDFNVSLSVNDKGKTIQTIETLAGAKMQLVVKVDKPVKSVKGYIIFKSKKPQQTSFRVPLNYLTILLQ